MKHIEQNNKELKVFEFKCHYLKIEENEEKAQFSATLGFTLPIQSVAYSYEEARLDALDRAQTILRELKDTGWYFRLMNN